MGFEPGQGQTQGKEVMMKGNIEQKISLAAISCLAITSYAVAAPGGSAGSHGGGPSFGGLSATGNSAFGHAQAGNPQTGSINSQYGQSTALAARSGTNADSDDQDRDNHKK